MLRGSPTENATGVLLFADYFDLKALHYTVHELAGGLNEAVPEQKAQQDLLLNFAYEVRKGFSGERQTQGMSFSEDQHSLYFGFQVVWTDMLVFMSTLRACAGLFSTDKLQQSMMYMLEHAVEEAMLSYDEVGAHKIREYTKQGIDTYSPYAFIAYQAAHIDFVTRKAGKTRFRNIPKLIDSYFNQDTRDYKEFIQSLAHSARMQNCRIEQLSYSDFPEIEW